MSADKLLIQGRELGAILARMIAPDRHRWKGSGQTVRGWLPPTQSVSRDVAIAGGGSPGVGTGTTGAALRR
jgi:hypothetical protein